MLSRLAGFRCETSPVSSSPKSINCANGSRTGANSLMMIHTSVSWLGVLPIQRAWKWMLQRLNGFPTSLADKVSRLLSRS